jgi:chromosomal replication initiator protein
MRNETTMQPAPVSVRAVRDAVARHHGLNPVEMVSGRRAAASARMLGYWLARELTPASMPQIARVFGRKDHTTVCHGIRQMERRMAEDWVLRLEAEALADAIRGEVGDA